MKMANILLVIAAVALMAGCITVGEMENYVDATVRRTIKILKEEGVFQNSSVITPNAQTK